MEWGGEGRGGTMSLKMHDGGVGQEPSIEQPRRLQTFLFL